MGSLSSRPSVPTQPQVVFVPQTTVTPPATPAVSDTSVVETAENNADASASEARSENLLRRSRGRLGTIQTGFSGLLSAVDTSAQRKTLLGE